ncbi:response regulator [Thermovenabulum gondwanense]|uniref:Stage 0 sporulation protein A homolog n=1 Tax=Thermovenabulum gondwanense TaxID=520767 RepID=A0A162MKD2_9FIRM|nr:response regulator transcription factor [Thermovenabulum gondwanense]KYO66480.1 Transcriptional regulatory protein DegU [Thermovenabulum gondwanense]
MGEEKKEKIKVIIADDHALVREGIAKILSLEADIEILGEASDGKEAVELAKKLKPDVVLMDINMPNVNGIVATREIKKENPGVKIIALTIHEQVDYLLELIRYGISGYLLKDVTPDELIKTIRQVFSGKGVIPPSMTPKVFDEINKLAQKDEKITFNLTSREIEILRELAKGLSNKEIADKLYISEKTVKNHLTNIFQKMGVNDRTQAVLLGIKHNIIDI